MIPGYVCQIRRANCQLSQLMPSVYRHLWVKKGYASGSIVARTFEYIYLGAYHVKTVSQGLVNASIGANSTDSRVITLGLDDWEVEIPRANLYRWYRENVIYYATQETFKPENDPDFLNEFGEIDGVHYRLLEVQDRSPVSFKLILREHQESRLSSNGIIHGQTSS